MARRRLVGIILLLAAIALGLVAFQRHRELRDDDDDSGLSVLAVHTVPLVANQPPMALLNGAVVRPGQKVTLGIESAQDAWVAVLGLSGDNFVAVYAPQEGSQRKSLRRIPQTLGEVQLSAGAGSERLVAVFCARAVSTDSLLTAARKRLREAGSAEKVKTLNVGCAEATLLLQKKES